LPFRRQLKNGQCLFKIGRMALNRFMIEFGDRIQKYDGAVEKSGGGG